MATKWDLYYYTHYKPIDNNWGMRDVIKYRKWYYSWINYIDKLVNLSKYKGCKALEIGCGVGAASSLIKEYKIDITGSDISNKIIDIDNDIHSNVDFFIYDVQKAFNLSNYYSIIFGFEVLEHLPLLKKSILNIYKGLKNNGLFIGTTPYPFKKNYHDPTHCNVKYPHEWRELFITLGFHKVEIYPMSFFPILWRISKYLNPVIPMYTPLSMFVSTTLIIARK